MILPVVKTSDSHARSDECEPRFSFFFLRKLKIFAYLHSGNSRILSDIRIVKTVTRAFQRAQQNFSLSLLQPSTSFSMRYIELENYEGR